MRTKRDMIDMEKITYVGIEYDCEFRKIPKVKSNKYQNKDVSLILEEEKDSFAVFLEAPKKQVKRVKIFWKNELGDNLKILGDAWERSYGELEWRGIVPERVMPWYFLVSQDTRFYGFGVKVHPSALCFWTLDQEFIGLTLDTRCGGEGVLLKNRKIKLADVVISNDFSENSVFEKANAFVKKLSSNMPVILPEEPVYGFNDWYYAYGFNSAERILEDSKLCSEIAEDNDNRPFSVIDAGWQYAGVTGGSPWISNRYFPDMRKLAEEIKKVGCKPGIWFRPLLTNERLDSEHALLFKRFSKHKDSKEVIMDPSVKENLFAISEDVKRFIDWGYELIKHDFTTFDIFGRWGFDMNHEITDDGWSFYDKTKTTAEIIKKLYETIFLAADSKALIIGCNTIGHLITGYAQIQRIGDDTSGIEWERTRKMGINTLAFRMSQHNTFFCNDADCVGIREEIPWELNKQWLELLANSSTPLFVSVKREVLNKKIKEDLKKAFKVAASSQKSAEPLDWLQTTCPKKWKTEKGILEFQWAKI